MINKVPHEFDEAKHRVKYHIVEQPLRNLVSSVENRGQEVQGPEDDLSQVSSVFEEHIAAR